jgi:hypothetical protein
MVLTVGTRSQTNLIRMKRAPFVSTTSAIVTILPLTLHQHVKSEFAAEPMQARFSFDVLGVTSTSTSVEVGLSPSTNG